MRWLPTIKGRSGCRQVGPVELRCAGRRLALLPRWEDGRRVHVCVLGELGAGTASMMERWMLLLRTQARTITLDLAYVASFDGDAVPALLRLARLCAEADSTLRVLGRSGAIVLRGRRDADPASSGRAG